MVDLISKKNFKSINKTLVLKIVAFSSVMTIILTLVQLYSDYKRDISKLNKDLNHISLIIVPEVSYSLWHMDIASLQLLLNSITGMQEFQYAEVTFEDGEKINSGGLRPESTPKRFPLSYDANNENRRLGNLAIYPNYSFIISDLFDRAIITFLSNGIKTFFVTFFMFSLFKRSLLDPLIELAKQAEGFSVKHLGHNFKISRKKRDEEIKDEVDVVVDGLNIMRENLDRDLKMIENANKERQDLVVKLSQSQKMESLGRLAGGVAHDFNNILHVIMSCADCIDELSSRDGANKEIASHIKSILDYGDRGDKLIKQILSYTHQKKVEFVKLNIVSVMSDALSLVKSTLPRNMDITFHNEKEELFIKADSTQIQQIIINLCTNARDAMKERGGTISFELLDNFSENYVILKVSDDGAGIKSEVVEKIFEPYFTTKDVDQGTGMGLSIIHSIILNMDGYINVDSKEGEGTTFIIGFPAWHGNAV